MCAEETVRAIESRLQQGRKPKAMIIVHSYGQAANLAQLMKVANQYEIPVIEDAAEALGSTYGGKKLGTFGKFGVLSFNGNKIITTSGGGALLSDDQSLLTKARFLSTQARDEAPHFQHSQVGYNYALSNVLAGIGRGQMEVLEERIAQRRAVFAYYREAFADMQSISFSPEPEHAFGNRWLSCILIDPCFTSGKTRETLRLALKAENIEARPLWKPMHQQPVFRSYPYYGSHHVADDLFGKGLCLPSGSSLSEEDLERIVSVVRQTLEK